MRNSAPDAVNIFLRENLVIKLQKLGLVAGHALWLEIDWQRIMHMAGGGLLIASQHREIKRLYVALHLRTSRIHLRIADHEAVPYSHNSDIHRIAPGSSGISPGAHKVLFARHPVIRTRL